MAEPGSEGLAQDAEQRVPAKKQALFGDVEVIQDTETDDPAQISSSSTTTTVALNSPDDEEGVATGVETQDDLEKQARRERRKSQKKGKNGSKERKKSRAAQKAVEEKVAEWAEEDGKSPSDSGRAIRKSGSNLVGSGGSGKLSLTGSGGGGKGVSAKEIQQSPHPLAASTSGEFGSPGGRRSTHNAGRGAAVDSAAGAPNTKTRHNSMNAATSSGELQAAAQNWDPNAPSEDSGRKITARTAAKRQNSSKDGNRRQSFIGRFMQSIFGSANAAESESQRLRRASIEKVHREQNPRTQL
mmetsp:Transcript_5962/g.14416  ORF Transcript_5962/g.14416 Transcript_5962/m.14416 type:complete len:299 (-) Transcript_5962:86-982(-)